MKTTVIATLAAVLLTPATGSGQTFLRLGAGATLSSTLVGQVIQNPINLRQSLAPTGTVLIGWRMKSGYRVGLEARYAVGKLEVRDDGVGSGSDDIGDLATLQIGVMADGPIHGDFRWEAMVGMLRYLPENKSGIFRGNSPAPLLVGAGVSWSREISGGLALVLAARVDFHSFRSQRLTSDGYSSSQGIRRGGFTLAIERGF